MDLGSNRGQSLFDQHDRDMSFVLEIHASLWGWWLSNSSIRLWQKVSRKGRLSEVLPFGYKPFTAFSWFLNLERDKRGRASHEASTNLIIRLGAVVGNIMRTNTRTEEEEITKLKNCISRAFYLIFYNLNTWVFILLQ